MKLSKRVKTSSKRCFSRPRLGRIGALTAKRLEKTARGLVSHHLPLRQPGAEPCLKAQAHESSAAVSAPFKETFPQSSKASPFALLLLRRFLFLRLEILSRPFYNLNGKAFRETFTVLAFRSLISQSRLHVSFLQGPPEPHAQPLQLLLTLLRPFPGTHGTLRSFGCMLIELWKARKTIIY